MATSRRKHHCECLCGACQRIAHGNYRGRAFFIAWALFGIACLTLLFSVLTETWSSKYKSSIEKSKVKQAIRKMQGSGIRGPGDINIDVDLLKSREAENEIAPGKDKSDMADTLLKAVKSFDEHAKYLYVFTLNVIAYRHANKRLVCMAATERCPRL